MSRWRLSLGWLLLLAGCAAASSVHLLSAGSRVFVTSAGEMFAEYRGDAPRGPAIWPLLAEGGEPMTRAYPFFHVDEEVADRPHHTSLWFAPGKLGASDTWQGDGQYRSMTPPVVAKDSDSIEQLGHWCDGSGKPLAEERRLLRFARDLDGRSVEFRVALRALASNLEFGNSTAGGLGLRLRRELGIDGQHARGRWWNSEGQSGTLVDGQRARWLAATALLAGELHTIAVFDHPDNHGHPALWQAKPYGLWVASPTLGQEPPLSLPAGAELRLCYGIHLVRGECSEAALNAAYERFVVSAGW